MGPPPGNKIIISVGSLSFDANADGIDWFIRNVWPGIRSEHPTAVYRVIGKGLSEKLKKAWSEVQGVQVVGFAKDLRAEYAACDFAIAPVLYGAGTKIKVIEALAYERACVITRHAYRGYSKQLADGREVMVCDQPADMIARCNELLSNPTKAAAMGNLGAEVVANEFSFDRFSKIVADSVAKALRTKRAA